jgi:SulP family sulfate permease
MSKEDEKEKQAAIAWGNGDKVYQHFDFTNITPTYVLKECLLGATIGFAQIPESVAFAYMAHIKPPLALHAAWMVGLICSIFGGRPGMVNGATGAFAAIIGTFLPKPDKAGGNGEGVELLFPSVMFAGFLMWCVAATRLSRFILLLPGAVMIGFCNGLGVVIGLAQTHPFFDSETHKLKEGMELVWMLVIMIVAMLTMEFLPKLGLKIGKFEPFKVIPSSLMAIISSIVIQYAIVKPTGSYTDTIGDVSKFTSDTAFPIPFFVDHPGYKYDWSKYSFNSHAIETVGVQGFLLCVVGTIESLMTSEVVESFTKIPGDGDRTVLAMGFGNVLSGFFGGMGGNAMIGLSTINSLNGGVGRLAPTVTALIVMAATMGAYEVLNVIPVAALSGIMIVVVLHTIKWWSVRVFFISMMPQSMRNFLTNLSLPGCFIFESPQKNDRKIPRMEAVVIALVTAIAILTNIAYAVLGGTSICGLVFAWNMAQNFKVESEKIGDTKIYNVSGPLFFASANKIVKLLDPALDPDSVEVHFGMSTVMDYSAMEAMFKLNNAYKKAGKSIRFSSVNAVSQKMIDKANGLCRDIDYKSNATPKSDQGPVDATEESREKKPAAEARAGAPAYVGL